MLEKNASQLSPSRVINIGSIDGLRVPKLETYSYSSSKAALHHLSRHLASHLAPRFITVNTVAPGPFQSKMMKTTLENFHDIIVDGVPLKRLGEPEDMAAVCIYLSANSGKYVTGALITVDGGSVVSSKI